MPNETTLPTAKMEKAVKLLFFDHLSDKEIAETCGVARSTLATWKKLPEFQQALRDFGAQQRAEAYALLESGADKAVRTLLELLDADQETTRLRAATELLKLLKADQPPHLPQNDGEIKVEINQFLSLISQQLQPSPSQGSADVT